MIEKLQGHPFIRHGDFRLLFIARLISAIGDKFFFLALVWFVLGWDDPHKLVYVGLVSAMTILPTVIFGPFMGTIVDRINRKKCLLLADIVRTLFMAIFAYLLWTDQYNIGIILIFVFIITAFTPLFESAVHASILSLTDEESLAEAVALDSTAFHVSELIGALLGSITIIFIGTEGAFFFNAFTFLVSFIIIVCIKDKLHVSSDVVKPDYMQELKEGFRYIFQRKPIFALTLFFAIFNFFLSALPPIMLIIIEDILGGVDYWMISLQGSFALGALLTAIILSFQNKVTNQFYKHLFIAALIMGLCFTSLGLTSNGWLISGSLFISGGALSYINATAYGLFQHIVPEEIKGRFFAILTTLCYCVMPITFVVNGILANYIHIGKVLIVEGCIAVLLSFLIFALPKINIGGDLS